MYLSSVILRNLFSILNIILFTHRVSAQSFGDDSQLERKNVFAVSVQPAYAVKHIDMVVPAAKMERGRIQDIKDTIKSFVNTRDYIFFSEGLYDCRKPLLMQTNSNKMLALMPFRISSEYNLDELEYNGYKIRFPTREIEHSPLLRSLKRENIIVDDVNDLVVVLLFLANQTASDAFWHELNENILDNETMITIVRTQEEKLRHELEESRNEPINTNTFMVQHMLYNRIFLDDVNVVIKVLKYLSQHGLKIDKLFGGVAKLDKYFIQTNLVQVERTLGRRVAMDKLLANYHFSYRNLGTIVAAIPKRDIKLGRRGELVNQTNENPLTQHKNAEAGLPESSHEEAKTTKTVKLSDNLHQQKDMHQKNNNDRVRPEPVQKQAASNVIPRAMKTDINEIVPPRREK